MLLWRRCHPWSSAGRNIGLDLDRGLSLFFRLILRANNGMVHDRFLLVVEFDVALEPIGIRVGRLRLKDGYKKEQKKCCQGKKTMLLRNSVVGINPPTRRRDQLHTHFPCDESIVVMIVGDDDFQLYVWLRKTRIPICV